MINSGVGVLWLLWESRNVVDSLATQVRFVRSVRPERGDDNFKASNWDEDPGHEVRWNHRSGQGVSLGPDLYIHFHPNTSSSL